MLKELSEGELERLTREFARKLAPVIGPDKDVPAPDVNTNDRVMAWIMDTYSMHKRHATTAVVTGKPLNIGGSRGRKEATGRGIMVVCEEALKYLNIQRDGCRVIIQGFGNVGSNAAKGSPPPSPFRPAPERDVVAASCFAGLARSLISSQSRIHCGTYCALPSQGFEGVFRFCTN